MRTIHQCLLVFDIDDTLTKTAEIHIKAFIESLHELGVKQMNKDFGNYKHHTDSYISRVIYEKETGKPYSNDVKGQFEQLLTRKMMEMEVEEIAGASKLVKAIQATEGMFVCFATGSLRRPALQKLKAIGIDFQSNVLVASDDIEERENIVSTAIKQTSKHYGIGQFDRIVSVGDGLWDLKTANNLGIEFIGVGEKNKAVLLAQGCTKHFNDFQDVLPESIKH